MTHPIYPEHRRDVDWPAVLERIDLTDAGISQMLTDYGLKISRVTITELRSGKGVEPRYSVGCALLELANCMPQDAPAIQDRATARKRGKR
jgi:hypothetical protein